ncbi:MAG: GxxExxY protein [Verrucomicrobia bacterium]|nr:GxxExxY protein [Verrucomicrobiota bacterium]
MLDQSELTHHIIAAAIQVHQKLGPGFLESIYENALAIELESSGLRFERQKTIPIFYQGRPIGEHRVDLLVEAQVLIELKAVAAIEPIFFAVVRSYLKALNLEAGLIFNFAAIPLTVKRVGREQRVGTSNSGKQEGIRI